MLVTTAATDMSLHSREIEDASIQAAMQPWVEMECYQLSPGKQLGTMEVLNLGSQQVVRESQMAAVQKLGVTPPNLCTLSYCTLDPGFRFSELTAASADTLFFIPERTEFDIFVPAGVQTAYVSLNQDAFLEGARVLNPALWESVPNQLFSLQTEQQTALKAAVNLWLETTGAQGAMGNIPDNSMLGDGLLQHVLHIATATSAEDSLPSPTERIRAFHICRMARVYIEERLSDDSVPTIVEICTVVGVSQRTLQYAFRAYVDMSPLTYIRFCRLSRVRATLRVSDPYTTTVTSVAMRYGFLHLGRFAQDYKNAFDESPSATLAS